jgi:hypothetical protein
MPKTRSRKIADLLSPASVAGTLSVDGGGGVATYTAIGDLPSSGLTAGDMAFVDSSDRLYIWTGAGWYNIAVVNQTPAIQSILDSDGLSSPFVLSNEGATTTITMIAADPDGFPVSYIAVADSDFNAMATLSQVSNVFTITPTAIEGDNTGTITFKASDGINLASEISTFTLTFITIIENSRYTSLLVQSVGDNNGVNSTFTDASANNLTLIANGDPVANTFSPYRAGGYSTYFDGTGDYLTTATDAAFAFGTGDFTLECWFNVNQLGVSQKLITFYPVGSLSGYNAIFINTNNTVSYGRNGANNIASSETITTNVWYHLAAVRQSGTTKLYLNGVQVGSNFTDSTSYLTARPAIGTDGYSLNTNNLFGYMSDIRIVKGTAVYTSAFTPPTEPLTAITNTVLLTCQNNGFVDNSVSAHAITVFGNTSVVPFGPYDHNPYDPAVNGGSVHFDGVGDYLTTTNTNIGNFGTANFTVEFWLYNQGSLAAFGQPISAYNANNAVSHWAIQLDRDVVGNIYWYNSINLGINSSIKLVNNRWTHLAVVRNSGTTTMYVNGLPAGSFSDSTNYVTPSGLTIGSDLANPQNWEFNGYLSNLRIVKGTAVYTAAFTPPTAPVTAISGTSLLINGTDASIINASQSTSALTLVGNTKSSTTQIKYGNSSMYFDGTGDYLQVPGTMPTLSADFTIEFWYYQNTTGQHESLFTTVYAYATANSLRISTGPSNNTLNVASGPSAIFTSNTAFSNTTWLHIALVRSGSTMTLYQNGVSVGSATNTQSFISSDFTIGDTSGAGSPYYLDGYMQDLRVTNGLARYTTNFTPPAALLEG